MTVISAYMYVSLFIDGKCPREKISVRGNARIPPIPTRSVTPWSSSLSRLGQILTTKVYCTNVTSTLLFLWNWHCCNRIYIHVNNYRNYNLKCIFNLHFCHHLGQYTP